MSVPALIFMSSKLNVSLGIINIVRVSKQDCTLNGLAWGFSVGFSVGVEFRHLVAIISI